MFFAIIGNGKLVEVCENAFDQKNIGHVRDTAHIPDMPADQIVVIHAGSGRQLTETVEYCQWRLVPLIQASTHPHQQDPQHFPPSLELLFPLILAPNLAIKAIRFLQALPGIATECKAMNDIVITESHQASKVDAHGAPIVSGTALVIAHALGVPEKSIVTIRDPEEQLRRGIPNEHLEAHACHWIEMRNGDTETTHVLKIFGREPYTQGAFEIGWRMVNFRSQIKPRVYRPEEILSLR